jgi:hypothetical protein
MKILRVVVLDSRPVVGDTVDLDGQGCLQV